MATGEQLRLPRGIRVFTEPHRDLPHACQWRVDRKRKTKFFETAEARDEFAGSLRGEVKSDGLAALRLDPVEARLWRAFRHQIGSASLDDVAACWLRHSANAKPQITVAQAIARMTAAKKAEGVAETTLKHYKAIHDRMTKAFGERRVDEVSRDDVAAWLAGLGFEPWSVRTHFIRVRSLFTWLRVNRHITHSPCDGMKAPRIVPEEVEKLTVDQGRKLFGAESCETCGRETIGRLALECFAGVRFSSAGVMSSAEIQLKERGLVLQASKIKTRRRQFIDGLPDNLWSWLEWSNPDDWKMTKLAEYMHAKSKAVAWAITKAPKNFARHSFCSYHVARHKDAARTAVILCHSSPKMLYAHYRGNATEEDGKAWFEIMPPP
jgi:site-specific recombinase XerC